MRGWPGNKVKLGIVDGKGVPLEMTPLNTRLAYGCGIDMSTRERRHIRTHQKYSCLFLPHGPPSSSLPQAVLDQIGSLQFFSTDELGRTLIGLNAAEIQTDFQPKIYSVRSIKFDLYPIYCTYQCSD